MSRQGKILVALDGFPSANAAAHAAIQFAQARSLSIYGLAVIDEPLILNPYANLQHELGRTCDDMSRDQMLALFKARGFEMLHRLEEQCRVAGVPVHTELMMGGVPELILRKAKQAEMLSLGRRGGNGDHQSDRLGHNFRHIAHHVHCPVIVGGVYRRRSLQRMLVAYDDNGHGMCVEDCVVEWAALLQRALPSNMIVLAMQHQDERLPRREAAIKACLDRDGLQNYNLVIRTGVTASAITVASITHHTDLIIMARYPHNEFIEWLTGSIIDTILRNSTLPVVMV